MVILRLLVEVLKVHLASTYSPGYLPMLILRLLVVVLKVHLASTYSPGCTHSSCYIKQNQDLLISYIFAPKVNVKIYQRHSFVLKRK